ncbi:MAG TPA: rhodanese-like domain-containing protein [Candidatus Absconditabacterales bacterium]|nr:rhodanese-like domain-containing protein [Candidatus Absconditabacterales bacterium]
MSLNLLTFYHFVSIPDIQEHIREHLQFTKDIGMKGRIYIGPEGISATLSGNNGQISAYRLYLSSKPYYQDIPDIDIKSTKVDEYYFDRMIVKYRDEIVALNYPVTPNDVHTYKQEVTIQQVKLLIDHRDRDGSYHVGNQTFTGKPSDHVVLLDMRNSYEYKLGHYKYAIPSGTVNFREMKTLLDEYQTRFSGKIVVMYCTGGIRCEKLAVMLHKNGLNNFYSIEGGIVKYVNTYNDGNRLGNLYTFDGRVSTRVGDTTTHTTIGHCIYSDNLTDHIENCRYSPCNARIICQPSAYRKYLGFCSKECCDRAIHNLRVKNIKRDKWDYQRIRDDIKKHPETQAEYSHIIGNFYHSRIGQLERRHLTSQKEEYIDCEC